jgi:hypothetical protein
MWAEVLKGSMQGVPVSEWATRMINRASHGSFCRRENGYVYVRYELGKSDTEQEIVTKLKRGLF